MKSAGFGSTAVAAAVLSVLLFVAAAPPAHADNRAKCQQRIEKAEARLDEAIRKHGENGPQARDRRRDLAAEREHCWNENQAWWDAHAHQWHNDRDWDHDAH
jgi:hypothetical protein